jgi:hypothetical protein
MVLSFLATGLRRFVILFKPSDRHEHDNSRGQKYQLVPSWGSSLPTLPLFTTASSAAPLSMVPACAAPPRIQSFSAIIAKLRRRTRATTAIPVLSTHTLTVTSVAKIQPLMPSEPVVADVHDHGDTVIVVEIDPKIRNVSSAIESESYMDKEDDNVSLPLSENCLTSARDSLLPSNNCCLPLNSSFLPLNKFLLPSMSFRLPSNSVSPSTISFSPSSISFRLPVNRLLLTSILIPTSSLLPSNKCNHQRSAGSFRYHCL